MNLVILKNELTNDPLSRGYSGMSDEEVSVSLNTINRNPNRNDLTGGMLASSIVRSELASLTNPDQNYIRSLLSAGSMPLTDTLKTERSNFYVTNTFKMSNI